MESLIGQILDNYRILSVIGKGGMGIVYKAIDTSIDKVVALKMIDPVLAQDSEFLRRFKTEARALAKLKNPHIVSVHTLRETEKGTFIVMEYVNPNNLADCIREKGLCSLDEMLPICRQLLDGIVHAHKAGIIHRDIKPSNILVSETGEVKITDFGLAKLIQEHGPDSTVAQVKAGTLNYMSPEQIKGLIHVDERSDIYSIGITIFEMITGRVPFEKTDSDFTIQKKIVDGNIPSPTKFNSSLPSELVNFVKKAIHKEPLKRFQSAEEMMKALTKIEIVKNDKIKFNKANSDLKKKKFQISKLLLIIAGFFILSGIIIIALKEINKSQENNRSFTKDDTSSIRNKTIFEKPEESFAKINISSYPPGGKIFLNGNQIGKTPAIYDSLRKGTYSIRIVKKNYREFQKEFVVSNLDTTFIIKKELALIQKTEKTKIIEKEVLKCNLTLQMVPAGNIYVDNELIVSNSTEEVSISFNPGKHIIKFEHSQLGKKDTTITLIKEEDEVLVCYFQRRVNIDSFDESEIPYWGSILIDGDYSGTTPNVDTLDRGNHIVYVKRQGCETREEPDTLNITPSFSDEPIPLKFHLRKK